MKISFSKYSQVNLLNSLERKNAQDQGLSLSGIFLKSQNGFADIHPWLEYGDPVIEDLEQEIINKLYASKENRLPLSESVLLRVAFANLKWLEQFKLHHHELSRTQLVESQEEPFLRKQIESQSTPLVVSHLSGSLEKIFSDDSIFLDLVKLSQSLNVNTVKFKIGLNIKNEIQTLKKIFNESLLTVRLDANSSLSFQETSEVLNSLSEFLGRIEFIEDPCRYSTQQWHELNKIVPLAIDWEKSKAQIELQVSEEKIWSGCESDQFPWNFFVVKPSREKWIEHLPSLRKSSKTIVITSQMSSSWDEYFCAKVHSWLFENNFPVSPFGGYSTGLFPLFSFQEMNSRKWSDAGDIYES